MSSSTGRIDIRVRYIECDPMGVAHHAIYPIWFEIGRTELLRSSGINYRDIEAQGILLAVVSMSVRYKKPARYDDLVTLETTLSRAGNVKIEHGYAMYRGEELLTTASTTLACLDQNGKLQPVPEILQRVMEPRMNADERG